MFIHSETRSKASGPTEVPNPPALVKPPHFLPNPSIHAYQGKILVEAAIIRAIP